MKLALILLVVQISFFSSAKAADDDEGGANNALLATKVQKLIKSAMKVVKEEEGVVTMTHPGNSYAPKTEMLFFRKRGTRIEMIATGVFLREEINKAANTKFLFTELNRDTVVKYPHDGDYVVPMTDPNLAALDGKDGGHYPAPDGMEGSKPPNPLPGYLEFGMGVMGGSLTATPSDQVNISKISSGYRFALTHFAYYSEFFPVGVELDSYKGNFPTKTYKQLVVASSESISNISINYRFRPIFSNHLWFTGRIVLHNNTFTTNNPDDSLLNTKTSGTGFGARAQYQFVGPTWKKQPNDFFIQLQNLFGDFTYYPSIKATDTDIISRGTSSSGSTGMEYRLGATALAWISFIPLFKRWVFQGSYGMRTYNLKFSGPTVSEPLNPLKVAENGTCKEVESDYRFFIGIRLEDPIKMIFQNDDKKEK